MIKILKSLLKENLIITGTIASVLAGIILAILFSKKLHAFLTACWEALLKTYLIPLWLTLILALGSLLLIFIILRKLICKSQFNYTMDEFGGLIWEWEIPYTSERNLECLCPKCFTGLPLNGEGGQTHFDCISCNKRTVTTRPYTILLKHANLEFDQRERTGRAKDSQTRIDKIHKEANRIS